MLLMLNKLIKSKFLKNSIIYTIGSMMTPLIGLIMLPVFTNYLSPTEYGIMTTVQSLVGMVQLVLLLSLHGAVTRFFYDFTEFPEKQKEYLGSIFAFVILFSTTLAFFLLISDDFIGTVLFKNIPINPYYYYLVVLSWVNALLALPMALLRAQEKAGFFVIINILKAFFIMGLTAFLIINKGLGAESALISQFFITFLIVLITFSMQLKNLRFTLNINFIKQSLLFSLPLLPHTASGWIIASSNRVILEKYVNISEIGIYSLATQVSMVLSLFFVSVNNALVPRYTSLRKEGEDLSAGKLLKTFFYLVLIFGIFSMPVSMYAITLFTSSEYHSAVRMIPPLLFGQIIAGFYFIPVAKLFYEKKTKAIAVSSTVAAIINIMVNFTTIPFIGIFGAILSSIVTELTRFWLIYRYSKKL